MRPMRSSRSVAAAAGGAFTSSYTFYTSAPSSGRRVGIVMLIVVVEQPFVPLLSRYVSTRRRAPIKQHEPEPTATR